MKNIHNKQVSLLGIFLALISSLFAQSPNPSQQPKSQTPYGWVSVRLSKTELLEAGSLSALYPEDKRIDTTVLQIKSYQISCFSKSINPDTVMMRMNPPFEDQFPVGMTELLNTLDAGDKIYFEYVKAWKIGSTEKLRSIPPLSVTLSGN